MIELHILPERSIFMDAPAFLFSAVRYASDDLRKKRSAQRTKNAWIYYAFNTKNAYICTQ